MTKQVMYRYLGTNGVIESPVHLEDIYYVRVNVLIADPGKLLTDGTVFRHEVHCPDEEIENWTEVIDNGQN